MNEPITAMVSYNWDDSAAAELLHEELALRGLTVFHDRCTFPAGLRIAPSMAEAVASCDSFVAYLTPSSLYKNNREGDPRPAIDEELLPVMDRVLHTKAAGSTAPIIVPITHGLGDPRTEAPERVRAATGRDISSLWNPVTLDQSTPMITQPEAAAVAAKILDALISRAESDLTNDGAEITVVTRGEGQPPSWLTVDATSTLGGTAPRPGEPVEWLRLAAGLSDIQGALAGTTSNRDIHLTAKTHLTGGLLTGRTFHQAAGWRPTVQGRHGSVKPATSSSASVLQVGTDLGAVGGTLAVEIDVLGLGVSAIAAATIASLGLPVDSRLAFWRNGKEDLTPEEIEGSARHVADEIRALVHDRRPSVVHVFCASPVELAVLVGHQLTSLHAPIHLYERDGDRYWPSLVLP